VGAIWPVRRISGLLRVDACSDGNVHRYVYWMVLIAKMAFAMMKTKHVGQVGFLRDLHALLEFENRNVTHCCTGCSQ
jgi:hypothetical protein